MIENEISRGGLRLAETEEFLARLFPIDSSIVDNVYEKLIVDGHYDVVRKEWNGLPTTATNESLYQPLVETAEYIRTAHTPPGKVTFRCRWISRHQKHGKPQDELRSTMRPDALCMLGMGHAEEKKWEALTDAKAEDGDGEEMEEERREEVAVEAERRREEQKTKRCKETAAWWRRVNVPVEIEPMKTKGVLKHIKRLFEYMRHVLEEQADRHFILGLLLSRTGLQVWLRDRSGVLGTKGMINIHEDPRNFIRIILACSLLPPEHLGWDPTMRLCRQPINPRSPEIIHSYDPSVKLSDYRSTLHDTNWVIAMPSKLDRNKREDYITVRTLSIGRDDSLSGRATIVWAAIKIEDMKMKAPPHHIYVLKQCWRPTAGNHEGDYFPDESKTRDVHLARIHSYEDVKRDVGVFDTQFSIRQGLDHFLPVINDVNVNGKRVANETAEEKEECLGIALTSNQTWVAESTRGPIPTWRTFARMLMEDYGWPIKNFRDLTELLAVSEQILATHRLLYFLGTLHRDISSGNVLICPSANNGTTTTEGRLIDLDCAKCTEDFLPSIRHRAAHEDKNPKMLGAARFLFQTEFRTNLTDEVVAACVFILKRAIPIEFADAILNYHSCSRKPTISGYDIGLLPENQRRPDFFEKDAWKRQRRLTLPYASAEILSNEHTFYVDDTPVFHDAVHDLEAFFWVLMSICITRGGPGGKHREELKPGTPSTPEIEGLFRIVNCFFCLDHAWRLKHNKNKLFLADQFETHVLPHVHPYFEPLKPLLKRWWKVLRIAYRFPSFETIHDWFLDAVREAISVLKEHPPETHPGSAEVDAFRREDLRSLQYFPNHNGNSQMTEDNPRRENTSRDFLGLAVQSPSQGPPSPTTALKKRRVE